MPIDPPYHDGQRLEAGDLLAALAREHRLRHRHVAALHRTQGVVQGLRVTQGADRRSADVAPGLAYDRQGRALVVAVPRRAALPAGADGLLDLVLGFAPSAPCPADPPPCGGTAAAAASRPVPLHWLAPGHARTAGAVVLARARTTRGVLASLDAGTRTLARPMRAPHVATGRTPAGAAWSRAEGEPGWFLDVDATPAGFVRRPRYFARFDGDPYAGSPGPSRTVLFPLLSVARPRPDGFRAVAYFGARTPEAAEEAQKALADHLRAHPPRVVWVGFEPVDVAPPPFLTTRKDL